MLKDLLQGAMAAIHTPRSTQEYTPPGVHPGLLGSILRLLDYNSGKQTHCKRKDEKANKSYLYRKGKKAQSRLVQESNNHLLNLESF